MAAVTAGVIAGAVIAAGASAVQGHAQRQQSERQASSRDKLAKAKRRGEVAAAGAQAQRQRDARAVDDAAAKAAGDIQLREQGIETGASSLDTGALGAAAPDASGAALGTPAAPTTLGG